MDAKVEVESVEVRTPLTSGKLRPLVLGHGRCLTSEMKDVLDGTRPGALGVCLCTGRLDRTSRSGGITTSPPAGYERNTY